MIRRYDDTGLDGEVAQTYYTANKDFERERVRRNNAAIKFSDIEQEPSARVAPDPESRSVGAQNLGSAATEREADLHREASKKYKETWALKMSA